jgi:hypothetical protein
MSQAERMLKAKLLSSIRIMVELTRNGKLSILIKPRRFQEQDSIQNGASIEIDHSISDPDFQ